MVDDPIRWTLTPHCCRICLGRIVGSGGTFRCAKCGAETVGVKDGRPVAICGCGIRIGEGKLRMRQLFQCRSNPSQTATAPSEIVIGFGHAAPVPASTDHKEAA